MNQRRRPLASSGKQHQRLLAGLIAVTLVIVLAVAIWGYMFWALPP